MPAIRPRLQRQGSRRQGPQVFPLCQEPILLTTVPHQMEVQGYGQHIQQVGKLQFLKIDISKYVGYICVPSLRMRP